MDSTMKRQKTGSGVAPAGVRKSRVFSPFRTVGLVANSVPCAVTSLGQTYVVSTAVGRSIQIYDAASLRLMFMTQPQAPSDIDCISAHFHHVFAVAGNVLLVYRRGKLEASATIPNKAASQKASRIVVFGGYICVSISNAVHIYKWSSKTSTAEFYTSLTPPTVLGNVVDISHPPTYVNKLIVATQACLVLYNVKTGKLLYTFNEVPQGITRVEASPTALDIVAVVSEGGDIVFTNVRTGKDHFTLRTGEPISSVSFRSDQGSASAPLLGVGTAHGDVFFYDLGLRRRVQSLRGFAKQDANIAAVSFLPGQSVCLVSAADNTLTELVFDPPVTAQSIGAHRARILRRRGGHAAASSCLLFADDEAHFLLSGSLDQSLWAFSLRKDSQSHAFGGIKNTNLLPIIDMSYTAEKQDRWDTLITAHKGSADARVWSVQRGALGANVLPTLDRSLCRSVTVSNCGNFGLVGSAKGGIAAYNLQSGLLRYSWPAAHSSAISGMTLTPNNAVLISASLDGTVKFHTFGPKSSEISVVNLEQGAITGMRFHAGSGLLCVSTDSMCLVLIDTATHKVVRELWGHGNRITSFDFAPSGRWVISASLDSTIRTWDVPTGACIDGVKIKNPATVLRVSPNAEWMATSHVQGVGIQLWALRSLAPGASFRSIGEEDIVDLDMPTVSGESGVTMIEGAFGSPDMDKVEVAYEDAPALHKQLAEGIITLSGEPRNKFTTLVHLDAIRERNKPKVGVQKPQRAPFYLGMTGAISDGAPSGDNGRDTTPAVDDGGDMSAPRVSGGVSEFTRLLNVGELDALVAHLASLGPAATDLEIRSLDDTAPYTEIVSFLDAMTLQVEKGTRFELVQAWVGMLLDIHRDVFVGGSSAELHDSFQSWLRAEKQGVSHLQEQVRFCSGVLNYLKQI